MERRSVQFGGRVQGVGFRATVRGLARALPVSGWVRNEPDGTVVAEIQGAEAMIERLLADIRGRMGRFIQAESSSGLAVVEGEAGFEIRH